MHSFGKKIYLILLLFVAPCRLHGQKFYYGLRVQAHQPILKNILSYQEPAPGYQVFYNSRERYTKPYLQFLGSFYFRQSKRLSIGIETGVYVNYLEKFFSIKASPATLRFTIQPSLEFILQEFKTNTAIGLHIKGGIFFLETDRGLGYFMKNGVTFNGAVFFKNKSGNKIYLGIEKEFNNAGFYFPPFDSFKEATGAYILKRISVYAGFAFNFSFKKI